MLNNNQFTWSVYYIKVLSLKCSCKGNKKKLIMLVLCSLFLQQLVVRLHVDQQIVVCIIFAGQKSTSMFVSDTVAQSQSSSGCQHTVQLQVHKELCELAQLVTKHITGMFIRSESMKENKYLIEYRVFHFPWLSVPDLSLLNWHGSDVFRCSWYQNCSSANLKELRHG